MMSKPKAPAKKAAKKATKAVAWRTDRISREVDPDTGRHLVDLPTVKGMTSAEVESLFAFEASAIGTTRAIIRMNKRHAGEDLSGNVPYRVATALNALDATDPIREFYA